ncbi:MAG: hypothetical protein A4E35_00236 [Methanoregula sp. PtaU1.Bin051]|nr:MAG: hypothetical protein A4E35_00236 [Methanoregula sp. PtaU1.Bin051]
MERKPIIIIAIIIIAILVLLLVVISFPPREDVKFQTPTPTPTVNVTPTKCTGEAWACAQMEAAQKGADRINKGIDYQGK